MATDDKRTGSTATSDDDLRIERHDTSSSSDSHDLSDGLIDHEAFDEAADKDFDVEEDLEEAPNLSTTGKVLRWITVALLFYMLIFSIEVIGDGFKMAAGDGAKELFDFAQNPVVGLMIGVLATTLIQSSSTTTSITVGLVAGGLPVSIAVPIIMGANIGTTLTNTLASLGAAGQPKPFKRAFAAATVHDFFNLLAVAILLPLEIMTGFLERSAGALAGLLEGTQGADTDSTDIVGRFIGEPAGQLVDLMAKLPLSKEWVGGICAVLGAAGILLVVRFLGQVLGRLMVGRAKRIMHASIGRGPASGMAAGTGITILAQSSSVTTSLMVPLAAAGTISIKQIYPYTLGANIGTTFTALIAALAASENAEQALQIALVHLLFNITAIVIIYVIPVLRPLPLKGAKMLATLATERKLYVVLWVVGVYMALPGLAIWISTLL